MNHNTIQYKLNQSFIKFSDRIALENESNKISYAELDQRTAGIANLMLEKGIKKGTFIGLLVDDRLRFITAMIGILRAGCVFVPLDTAYPANRLELMILSTDIKLIISDKANSHRFLKNETVKESEVEFIHIEDLNRYENESRLWDKDGKDALPYYPDDKVYIYFTSGSTGKPKAVVGKNESLLHFINWEIDTFGINETHRFSQFTNPGFDVFLRDIFVPLCAGGTVCIPGKKEIMLTSEELTAWIDGKSINLIHCVPSLFRVFNTPALEKENFKDLKYILFAGEKVVPAELKNWYSTFEERIQLVNLYGPTETTLAKAYHLIRPLDTDGEIMPIGKHIRGARIIILDENMNICEKLVTGEIYIRTPYRTFGYYNAPGLNQKKFIPNPLNNNDPDDVLYKTGDLGRLLPDGNIELLGRIDRQVKMRGMRIELDEIENTLLKHPSVKETVVIKKEITGKNEFLFACITKSRGAAAEDELLIANLKQYLSENLPGYMVPSNIMLIEQIPRKVNGKVDYDKVSDLADDSKVEYVSPRNNIEAKLLKIWSEILRSQKFGITNTFFSLGGNSLSVMTLIANIHKEFDIRLTLEEIFKNNTIEMQAERIKEAQKDFYTSLEPVPKKEYYTLSSAQKRLYIVQQMGRDNVSYNISNTLVIEGKLNRHKVEEIFRKLIERHENFRTSFELVNDQPVQRIHEAVEFEMEYDEASKEEIKAMALDFKRPFELHKAPLLRLRLIKITGAKHILMLDMHHIISDGMSITIFAKEFMVIYEGKELPPLKFQYKDYSEWQWRIHEREPGILDKQEKYWLKEFEGEIPVLNIPTDYERSEKPDFEGKRMSFEIDREETEQLGKLADEEGVTLYILLMAVYSIFLSKISGQEDIVVGTFTAGRDHVNLEDILGIFVNTLAIKTFPLEEKSFVDFLKEVREKTLGAFENQKYQYEDLVELLRKEKGITLHSLFEATFLLQNFEIPKIKVPGLEIRPYEQEFIGAKFDLSLSAVESDIGLSCSFVYKIALFKQETIEWFIKSFKDILTTLINDPHKRLFEIEMISEEERMEMLDQFSDELEEE